VVAAFAFDLFALRCGCLHLHSVIALAGPGGGICISFLSNAMLMQKMQNCICADPW